MKTGVIILCLHNASQIQRERVISMLSAGRSARDVARFFAVHESTISCLRARFEATNSTSDRLRSGRPCVTTCARCAYVICLIIGCVHQPLLLKEGNLNGVHYSEEIFQKTAHCQGVYQLPATRKCPNFAMTSLLSGYVTLRISVGQSGSSYPEKKSRSSCVLLFNRNGQPSHSKKLGYWCCLWAAGLMPCYELEGAILTTEICPGYRIMHHYFVQALE